MIQWDMISTDDSRGKNPDAVVYVVDVRNEKTGCPRGVEENLSRP